jgi:hypothetical protein
MENLNLYHIQIPRFIPYAKTLIYIIYQNLDLYRTPKPRYISHMAYGINLGICIWYKFRFSIWYKSRFWYAR